MLIWIAPLLPLIWIAFQLFRLLVRWRETDFTPPDAQNVLIGFPLTVLAIGLGVRIIAGEMDLSFPSIMAIGMVAFIANVPATPLDSSAALPVQIYLWADSPERAFLERTSAGIMVLLGFLILMNLLAIMLRRKFERRW